MSSTWRIAKKATKKMEENSVGRDLTLLHNNALRMCTCKFWKSCKNKKYKKIIRKYMQIKLFALENLWCIELFLVIRSFWSQPKGWQWYYFLEIKVQLMA